MAHGAREQDYASTAPWVRPPTPAHPGDGKHGPPCHRATRSPGAQKTPLVSIPAAILPPPLPSTQDQDASAVGDTGWVNMLTVVLLIIAAVCFTLAAFEVKTRVNLIAVGLLAWVLTLLIPALT